MIARPSKSNHNNKAFDGSNSSALHTIRADAPFCVIFSLVQFVCCLPLRCEGTEEPRVNIGRGLIAEITRQTAGDSPIIESTDEATRTGDVLVAAHRFSTAAPCGPSGHPGNRVCRRPNVASD